MLDTLNIWEYGCHAYMAVVIFFWKIGGDTTRYNAI